MIIELFETEHGRQSCNWISTAIQDERKDRDEEDEDVDGGSGSLRLMMNIAARWRGCAVCTAHIYFN